VIAIAIRNQFFLFKINKIKKCCCNHEALVNFMQEAKAVDKSVYKSFSEHNKIVPNVDSRCG